MSRFVDSDQRQVAHARQLLEQPDPSGLSEWVRRHGQLEVAVSNLLALVDRLTNTPH